MIDRQSPSVTDLLQLLVDVLGRILGDEIVDLLLPAGVLLVLALGQSAEVTAPTAKAGRRRHILGQAVDVVGPGRGGVGGGGGGTVVALK